MPVVVDLPDVPPTAMETFAELTSWASSCGPRDLRAAEGFGVDDVGHGVFDGGGGDEELVRAGDAGAVLRVEPDAAGFQEVELGGGAAGVERAVRAFDVVAAGLDDQGERQHSAAADAAEEVGSGVFECSRGRVGFCIGHDGMSQRGAHGVK